LGDDINCVSLCSFVNVVVINSLNEAHKLSVQERRALCILEKEEEQYHPFEDRCWIKHHCHLGRVMYHRTNRCTWRRIDFGLD